jgi:hypothetical protein
MIDQVLGQKLSDCSREYANATLAALAGPGGVHPPTVISACSRMAGTYLFRSFELNLNGVQPGQVVLSAEASQHSPMLLRVAAGILSNLNVTIADSPTAPSRDEVTQPTQEFLQTQRLLEPLFAPIRVRHDLTTRQAAQAAAIAVALLIHHFVKQLEPNTAFGIAAIGFIEGCKTAPDPVELAGGAA